MSLQSNIELKLDLDYQSVLDLGNAKNAVNYQKLIQMATGVAVNQADLVFHDNRTLAASGSEELDLAGGLTDAFGVALTFVKIKGIVVFITSALGGPLLIGGAAANAFVNWVSDATDEVRCRKFFALVAPDNTAYAVTATAGDLLRIENEDGVNAVTYDIVLIGTSS